MLKQLFATIALSAVFYPFESIAQVIPDNTLGAESSTVRSINEMKDAIEGGAIRGNSLFHSFQEFKIRDAYTTEFANPQGITNIFSRVTGSNISEIFGTLAVDGSANLFLINPNGIVFGENAAVNIGGSFMATTAESIEFNSGDRFSTIEPGRPLLTIDFPIGLGMGSNPGDIDVIGKQNNVQLEIPGFRVVTENLPESIQVSSGENISLIGGKINFSGGGLQAPQGYINIVSVNGNQTLRLLPKSNWFTVDLDNVSIAKDIIFNNAAYVDVSGEEAGNIDISGRNIIINGGSVILADTSSPTDSEITINATDSLRISGSSGNNELNVPPVRQGLPSNALNNAFNNNSNFYSISLISADVLSDFQGGGTGSNIKVNAKNLQILDAGQIRTVSFSNFDINRAGNISVDSESILIEGTNNIDGFIGSVINSSTGAGTNGNSGDVLIITSSLIVRNGGRIKADTFGAGNGGKLNILSEEIVLEFTPNNTEIPAVFKTGLSASPGNKVGNGGAIDIDSKAIYIKRAEINNSSFNRGTPGDIVIDTEQLKILDGGSITAETASGRSANITINARDIELNGTNSFVRNFVGGISTSTRPNSFGDGGNVNITTNSLKVLEGAVIRAISLGSGDAGNINIDAETIKILGVDRFAKDPVASQRVSKINTGALRSNGGELFINSESIKVSNLGLIQATTRGGVGNGGNITINSSFLELFDRVNITASAEGQSNGGNITIDSDTIIGISNSDITANAVGGDGGNITIDSNFIVGLEERSQLTRFNDITATSEFGIDGTVTVNAPESNADEDVIVSAKEIDFDPYRKLFEGSCLDPNRQGRQELVYVGSGRPESPYNFFDDEEPQALIDSYQSESNNLDSEDNNIPPLWQEGDPLIEPNAIQTNSDGRKFLVAVEEREISEPNICDRDAQDLEPK